MVSGPRKISNDKKTEKRMGLYCSSMSKLRNSGIDLSRNLGLSCRTRVRRVIVTLPSRKMCVGSKWVLLLNLSGDSL